MSPLFARIYRRVQRQIPRLSPLRLWQRLRNSAWPLRECYTIEDNTQVTLFTRRSDWFPNYHPRVDPLHAPKRIRVHVSLVATARNEQENAPRLIACLLQQTRLPDEIVIVDTGSQDGTVAALQQLAAASPVPLRVLEIAGGNIASGRNRAIAAAHGPVIAVTDFGCEPQAEWLESIVAPFEINPKIQVSAGRYLAVDADRKPVAGPLWSTLERIEPQSYLPPGCSMAFTKTAWEGVGGFPEWLTLTGEDTYFDLELKRATRDWAFSPDALAWWEAPQGWRENCRKAFRWSTGNGEIGLFAARYRQLWLKVGFVLGAPLAAMLMAGLGGEALPAGLLAACWLALILIRLRGRNLFLDTAVSAAYAWGYLRGASRRAAVDIRRWSAARGVFFILAGVPVEDTGGGSRFAQIALELIRRGWVVVYINEFPKREHNALDLAIRHPNLLTFTRKNFDATGFLQRQQAWIRARPLRVLVELPIPDFLPVIERLRAAGASVVYDLLDDWDTALGGQWYTPETERAVIAASSALVATAPGLAARLEKLSARPVTLLPNAVNSYLFNPHRFYPPPADLPAGAWRAIYIGALWGEWFDWALLTRLAQAYPEAAIVVIGDYAGQCPHPPPNLHFLGLKAQRDLPPYLAHSHVAILPWKVNTITQATSPLKVYEYLAMRKPVVAPDIQPLRNIPGVTLAASPDDFIAQVGTARTRSLPETELAAFIAQNDWAARVDALLRLL